MSKKSKGTPSPAARLRAKIRQAERTLARHQAVLDAGTEDGNGYLLNLRKDNAANARRKIARLSETLAAMEAANAPEPDAPAPYHAFRELHGRPIAEMCGLSGNVVPRGTRIPSAIEQTYNFPQLLSTGAIRRGPPPVSRPPSPALSAPRSVPVRDPLGDYVREFARLTDGGLAPALVEDAVESSLLRAALKAYADGPGANRAFIGGRSVDGFHDFIAEKARQMQEKTSHGAHPA